VQLPELATQLATHLLPALHAPLQHCVASAHATPLRSHIVEQGVHATPQLLRHVVVLQLVATHPASAPPLDPPELPLLELLLPDPLLLEPLEWPLLEPLAPELLPLLDPLPLDAPELLPLPEPLDPLEVPLLDPLLDAELPLPEPLDPVPLLDPLVLPEPLPLEPLVDPDPLLLDPLVVASSPESSGTVESPAVESMPEELPPPLDIASSPDVASSLDTASSPDIASSLTPLLDEVDDPDEALPPLPLLAAPSFDVTLGPSVAGGARASTRVGSSMPRMVPQAAAPLASPANVRATTKRPYCRRTARTINSSTIPQNT
jgi:hypothetical protein